MSLLGAIIKFMRLHCVESISVVLDLVVVSVSFVRHHVGLRGQLLLVLKSSEVVCILYGNVVACQI
jgi:hypothetical protein